MPTITAVSGFAEGAFQPLADVFARVVATQGTGGAALAIRRDGVPVVDLVGGDYAPDSLQLVFSVSKSITAIAAALASAEGDLDLDEPLAGFWPAMEKRSTRSITVRQVLSHRSGLASVDRRLSLDDLLAGRDIEAVEEQEPYWEPDSAHGYHAFTFATLMEQVFLRRLGTTVGEFVERRLAGPLGLDLWLRAPDDVVPRIHAVQYSPPELPPGAADHMARSGIPAGTTSQLSASFDVYNSPELRRLGFPSTSGVAGARDLAALFAATLTEVDGVRLLSDADVRSLARPLSGGIDRVLGVVTAFGSGVQLPFPRFPMLGPTSFGHEAAGGSAAFADPESGIALGFTTSLHPPSGGASSAFLALLPALTLCLRDLR